MKICIIGGLGYVGFELAKRFKALDHEVAIIDKNMYGKWDAEEITKLAEEGYEISLHGIELMEEDNYKDVDVFIICSDVDFDEFYSCPELEEYLVKYEEAIGKIVKTKKQVQYIYSSGGSSKKNYVFGLIDKYQDVGFNFNIIGCPQLYGTSNAFRSDTVVNKMVMDFISNEYYLIDRDPIESVEICNIHSFADWVVGWINNESESKPYSRIPILILANMVQKLFGGDCQIGMSPTVKTKETYNDVVKFNGKEMQQIELFVNEIKRGIELGPATRLFNLEFDNTLQMQYAVQGMRYKDMFS